MEIRQFASDHLPISFQPGSGRAANEGLPCGQPQSTLFGYLVPEGTLTTTTQHLLVILAVMPDVIPTTEAAKRIGVTPQTIRNLIAAGELQGTSKPWGKKRRLRYVEVESLDRYCEEASNAAAPKRRRIDRLEEEVRRIAEVVDGSPDITGPSTAQLEKISSLQDAMARLRDVIELNRKVEDELDEMKSLNDQIIAAHRRIDSARRQAIEILEDALVASTQASTVRSVLGAPPHHGRRTEDRS